jgi:hypothetical protein
MFDMILDNYRRAAESTMKVQQDVLRNWTAQWPQMFSSGAFGLPGASAAGTMPGVAWLEQMGDAQKKWAETISEILNKHRESLDAQYRAGIKTIEDAFKVGEARDPQQFRRLTEELWRHSFDCLKTVAESQIRDVQSATQKWFEIVSKSATGMKI